MCDHTPSVEIAAESGPGDPAITPVIPTAPHARGSRRRRLWEFENHAFCPMIGVCLPMGALRRLVNKVVGGQTMAQDYELHCGVITECKQRSPLSNAVQRELDQRYVLPLRQAALCKTTESLSTWWKEHSDLELGGALWATLTHARCTLELENQVLAEVHMMQHQVGVARRVDVKRFEALMDENTTLARELAQARQRCTRLAEEQARATGEQQVQVMQLRAQLIARQSLVMALREDLQTLESAAPDLRSRVELARATQQQTEQIHTLERALLLAQQDKERRTRQLEVQGAALARQESSLAASQAHPASILPARLDDRSVLCVGGRPASVPLYRHIVEGTGGRFLHHDGGDEESAARLDATLAAADLVICQTGCISHNAYWRVKDYCKRTGKQCVFVENPGTACLKRALSTLQPFILQSQSGEKVEHRV
jgi:hypothetical protein